MCIKILVQDLYKSPHIMHEDTFDPLAPKEQGCIHDIKKLKKLKKVL